MATRDVVVVGASAGGVEALRMLVGGLPADFPGTLLVVLHIPAIGGSALPTILARTGPLPVRHAREGDRLEPGHILVAPPDQHLIVYDGAVTLSRGPKENGHRPAVDVLFRSAAKVLGPRVVSVVLSGALDDGAAGTVAVKLRGGLAVCQDPADALHASMPASAMQAAEVDHVVPAAQLAGLLTRLVTEEVPDDPGAVSALMEIEAAMANLDEEALNAAERPGRPAGYSCPDCHGTLFEITEGGLVRFRCRVGHAWSLASLVAQQSSSVEGALWLALRTLEEKAALTRRLGRRAAEKGHQLAGEAFDREATEVLAAATTLRDLIDALTERDPYGAVETEVAGEREA
ncbi:chemotaxis protein CheB [Georgenia thermotolerans]|uniref:protein-glutamate methylesterase n=1 Tax=Georgenia thermotolerans TaxID=527326 RepID=A0A7J5USD9_9MICO|nr:chemotaxis protein CheB [Georgenia thermotolerans]KAE8765299.1 chemotaxis protein CheB [Georgenia thermotolerans]